MCARAATSRASGVSKRRGGFVDVQGPRREQEAGAIRKLD